MACALTQRILQVDRPVVLLKEIREGLLRQLLKCLHLITRKEVQRLPSLLINLHALARHGQVVLFIVLGTSGLWDRTVLVRMLGRLSMLVGYDPPSWRRDDVPCRATLIRADRCRHLPPLKLLLLKLDVFALADLVALDDVSLDLAPGLRVDLLVLDPVARLLVRPVKLICSRSDVAGNSEIGQRPGTA